MTNTAGDRLDAAITAARESVNDLRTKLADAAAELGADINAAVDAVQARIDEIQAARQGPDVHPPEPPQATQLPS
jgi:hypothetical protein